MEEARVSVIKNEGRKIQKEINQTIDEIQTHMSVNAFDLVLLKIKLLDYLVSYKKKLLDLIN